MRTQIDYALQTLTKSEIYEYLSQYVLDRPQRFECGYPIWIQGDEAYIKPSVFQEPENDESQQENPSIRTCCRCKAKYVTSEDGLNQQKCRYHSGKFNKYNGYSCCNLSVTSKGCIEAKTHVSLGRTNGNLFGFVDSSCSEREMNVFALDCEMSFTTRGLEVVKVTLIRLDGSVAYNELVKPPDPIIDYNTRFSGIDEAVMSRATKSLRDVQNDLLKLINANTILIGHAMQNDLRALRLVHLKVVDTSVVFPHCQGLPYRLPLQLLVSSFLGQRIQGSTHDSAEDARACMDLMLFKIRCQNLVPNCK